MVQDVNAALTVFTEAVKAAIGAELCTVKVMTYETRSLFSRQLTSIWCDCYPHTPHPELVSGVTVCNTEFLVRLNCRVMNMDYLRAMREPKLSSGITLMASYQASQRPAAAMLSQCEVLSGMLALPPASHLSENVSLLIRSRKLMRLSHEAKVTRCCIFWLRLLHKVDLLTQVQMDTEAPLCWRPCLLELACSAMSICSTKAIPRFCEK